MRKIITIICMAFTLFSSSWAQSQSTYQWKIAETWPKDFPLFGDAVKKFIDNVTLLSNGRLNIKSEARDVHKKPLGVFDMVKEGDYEMGHSASFYWKDKDINTAFFTSLPMGLTAVEQYGWFYYGGGQSLMEKAYAKYGLLSFPGGNTGMQMGGWFNKPINTIEDLQGLKMRIPGLGGQVLQELGVETVNIPAGDLLDALKTGKVDALEWVGPSMDVGMGFHTAAKYYYTGWHEPATELQFIINQKAFDTLPKDLQQVVLKSMRLAAYDTYIQAYHSNSENLDLILREHPDIIIRAFPPRVFKKILAKTIEVLDALEKSSNDPLTRDIVGSIKNYKNKVRQWTRFSDTAYINSTPGF
ncbi:MAG: TRAP transporter substrate-binding protein [Arenicella sp.]